jgi:hypothetical protein
VVERLSQDSIVEALAHVPHDFRDVLVLVDIGDFSYADTAQILDIPIGTVMSDSTALAYPEGRVGGGGRELSGYAFDPCAKCEESCSLPRPRPERGADARGGSAPRRMRLLPPALPLRGLASPLRAAPR